MDRLSQIIASKRMRIDAAKAAVPLDLIRAQALKVRASAAPHALALALNSENPAAANIIAEFKRRSPSKGLICENADAPATARSYASAGAAAISVLTEEDHFDGSLDDLRAVRAAVTIPILRKDFILEEYQVYESAAAGADSLLLIVAALDDGTLDRLLRATENELEMDALVEVHTKEEMDRAVAIGARLIGINNRDLRTFEVSIGTSLKLSRLAPANAVLVSESGLTPEVIGELQSAGYKGFLVGEALMRATDPEREMRSFARRN